MATSLKDANRLALVAGLAINLAIYYGLTKGLRLSELTAPTAAAHAANLIPGGALALICGLLNAQLSATTKARIVFLRWSNPLPGSRVFSELAPRDPRVDMRVVQEKWSPLPNDPPQQNALWYRVYQGEAATEAVAQLNRSWLFARDYACMCVLLFVGLGTVGLLQMPSPISWVSFAAIIGVQFIVARQAAVQNANRFVLTVIAQAAAKP